MHCTPQKETGLGPLTPAFLLSALALLLALLAPHYINAEGGDPAPDKIDPTVLAALREAPDGTVRVLIHMAAQPSLEAAARQPDPIQRRQRVYEILRHTAQESQANLLRQIRALAAEGHVVSYRPFWIFNGLAATLDRQALEAIAARDDVAQIALDCHRQRLKSPTATPIVTATPSPIPTPTPPYGGLEWNIALVNADDVWEELGITGEGVVVANIDTGVYYAHPALITRYRGYHNGRLDHNYNWFDATGQYPSAPADGNGHGTHTMGTIVGQDGDHEMGLAPGAQWIAVKALDDWGYGWDSDLHAAFQWVLAPTDLNGNNPDPSRAPDVVNNSWGDYDGADTEFQADVQALLAAGIVPVFSAGNNGPRPGTIESPASYPEALAVAATDRYDAIAYFSSRGPSPLTEEIKPDLAAPGVDVLSSWNDGGYATLNGTSMAAPHVAGLAALMLQSNPTLTVAEIESTIEETAIDLGSPGPDYDYGAGRIDAYQAVLQVAAIGTLTGQVREAVSGDPIATISITAAPRDGRRPSQTTTDASGCYTLTLPAGLYDVTASGYGYLPATAQDVTIVEDGKTHQDFALSLAPRYQLYGTVTEAGTGVGLAATLTIHDTPLSPVETNPATGAYSVTVAQGTYMVEVWSWEHASARRTITLTQDLEVDFSLPPLPPILFVDDDAGADYESYFAEALDSLAQSYDTWEVIAQGEPTAFDLAPYPILIWTTADAEVDTLSGQAEAALMDYLDRGGHLFLSSRGYPLERGGSDFSRDYLHLYGAGKGWDITSVKGVEGNPVGAWLGPFSLEIPFSRDYVTYFKYHCPASLAFAGYLPELDALVEALALTTFDRATCHKIVLFGFPFEALQPADARVVLRRILQWFEAECSMGTLAGRVTSAHTGQPVAGATVQATGPRDRLSTTTDYEGRYALLLIADDYSISASRAGFTTTTASVTVAPDVTTTLDIALPPLIAVTPPSLTLNITAGQVLTCPLALHNDAAVTLTFALFEGSEVYTPARLEVAAGPVPILEVPFSEIAPTLDGAYTPGEWDDTSRVTATRYDTPDENPVGDVRVKHTADALYVLMDFFTADPAADWLETDIRVDLDNDGYSDGGFFAYVYKGYPELKSSYPATLGASTGATPGHPDPHWLLEFQIPLEGIGQTPGSVFSIYFAFQGPETPPSSRGGPPIWYGEWPNPTTDMDYSPSLWAELVLAMPEVPWLWVEPVTGTVPPGQTGVVTVTIDTTLAQPGDHATCLHLYSQDGGPVVAEPQIPITLALEPSPTMGQLSGTVSDARTGEPVGATLTAPGGQAARADPATGEYLFWLEAGTWPLELRADGYLTATEMVTITAQAIATRDFILRPDAPELELSPLSFTSALTCGQRAMPTLLIANAGSQPLAFQLYETTFQDDLAIGVTWEPGVGVSERLGWPARREPPERRTALPLTSTPDRPWEILAFDAPDDSLDAVELVRAEAAVDERTLALRLVFDEATLTRSVVGYIHLDTDRRASTGSPPKELAGKPEQEIGFDYYLDLFGLPGSSAVALWRADGTYLGDLPALFDSQAIEISVPLALMRDYDGLMDVTLVVGDVDGPADWLPDAGHSIAGVGAAWLAEAPVEGTVAPGDQITVNLTLDTADVQPGEYGRRLAVVSSDPLSPTAYLPVTLTVQPKATMGQLTGRVINGQGRGLWARIRATEGPTTRSDPITGAYSLWLEEGGWQVTFEGLGTPLLVTATFPVTVAAQMTYERDITLSLYEGFMPLIGKR